MFCQRLGQSLYYDQIFEQYFGKQFSFSTCSDNVCYVCFISTDALECVQCAIVVNIAQPALVGNTMCGYREPNEPVVLYSSTPHSKPIPNIRKILANVQTKRVPGELVSGGPIF